jgi:DNA-binding IclR family transcriptional regulator
LEAKVKQLREQLELRRKEQDEIVDFRLKQLLREAQGLGWGTDEGAIQYRSTQQAEPIRALEELRKVAPASEVFMKSREKRSGAQAEDRDAPKR